MLLGMLLSLASYATVYISQPTTWTTSQTVDRIVILPNGSLTITGGAVITLTGVGHDDGIRVYSNSFNALTQSGSVAAGGQLVVDNATLTGANLNSWAGVCVMGNVRVGDPYYPPPIGYSSTTMRQSDPRVAKAVFRNNAVVKNSRFGVSNYDIGGTVQQATAGGIIQATNTTFKDNFYYAVRMTHYRNFRMFGGRTLYINDQSFFNACNFERVDAGLVAFMYLHEVSGINVLGSKFTVSGGKNVPFHGIYLENAGVNVDTYCPTPPVGGGPCTGTIASEFNGLQHAVYAGSLTQNGSYRIGIQRAKFNNCRNGINLSNTSQAYLVENNFTTYADYANQHTAIFLGGSTGFKVEGNTINTLNASGIHSETWRIVVKNSGVNPNVVYRNTITNAYNALQAVDLNGDLMKFTGLRFLCNTMSNAVMDNYDITVEKSTPSSRAGISPLQANPPQAGSYSQAENVFSNLTFIHNYFNNGYGLIYVGYIDPNGYTGLNLVPGPVYNCKSTLLDDGGVVITNPSAFLVKRQELEVAIAGSSTGQQQELLAQYAKIHYDMLNVYYGLWNDEGAQDLDSAIWVLSNAKYLPNLQVQKASLEARLYDWDKALQTLSQIPLHYTLSDAEQDELVYLTDVYKVGKSFAAHNNVWDSVSTADKAIIQNIAHNALNAGSARFAARYFLSAYEGAIFSPEVVDVEDNLTSGLSKKSPAGNAGVGTVAQSAVEESTSVYPNPTLDGEVRVSGVSEGTRYTLKDLTGRLVLSGTFAAPANVLSLKALPGGIYTLQLVDTNSKVSIFKIARP